jgi:hypothetical protein
MLEEFDLIDCNAVRSPYRSDLTMDLIARDHVPPDNKPEIVKPYQRLVGGLNWLAISTRPDLAVSVSLLSQFMQDPSEGHMDAGKRVLAWLSSTWNHGLRFTHGGNSLRTSSPGLTNPSQLLWPKATPMRIEDLKTPPIPVRTSVNSLTCPRSAHFSVTL